MDLAARGFRDARGHRHRRVALAASQARQMAIGEGVLFRPAPYVFECQEKAIEQPCTEGHGSIFYISC